MVRSSRASSRTLLALLGAIAVAGGTQVSAHRLDELLQATRIAIEPDRVEVEMSLTPGTAVAGDLIREIDADGNGAFSVAERQAYADRALSSLVLHLDEGPRLRMAMAGSSVPDAAAMRTGDAVIVLRAVAVTSSLAGGPHRLFFRNEHAPADSVYLANALVPDSHQVAITGQLRDGDQRALTIEFTTATAASAAWLWLGLAIALTLGASRLTATQKGAPYEPGAGR